ncbi:MAG: hypothetical protein OER85_14865 [Gammaproteobacteria bacterium]|nr:hypothetical protein [Gammaproteobacteria bacterium]
MHTFIRKLVDEPVTVNKVLEGIPVSANAVTLSEIPDLVGAPLALQRHYPAVGTDPGRHDGYA